MFKQSVCAMHSVHRPCVLIRNKNLNLILIQYPIPFDLAIGATT